MSVLFRTSDGTVVPFPYGTTRLEGINKYYNVQYNGQVIDVDIPLSQWKSAVLFAKLSESADQNVDDDTRVKLILRQCKLREGDIEGLIETLKILGSTADVEYLEFYRKKIL